jgi:hypothetical protein
MPLRSLNLDPGPKKTAWIWLLDGVPGHYGHDDNELVLESLRHVGRDHVMVIEKIASYGMPVGEEIFETVRWSGRFEQASFVPVLRVTRATVKMHLCKSMRANDATIRQAILDRFDGKGAAIGKKNSPGPLYGISGDVWAALAVGLTWYDLYGKQ